MDTSWLKRYISLSEGTEIPDMFALWCGLSGISASLGRSVHLNMGTYKIYPNMFIILVAGSGRCRKSTSIGQIENLLAKMSPRPNIIAQKITPEALIEAVCDGRVTEKKATVIQIEGSPKVSPINEGFVVVDELSNFLNKKSYEQGLAALLISLYDCKDSFEYRTKGRGKEELKGTCLGLLGGSTIEWIREAVPADAIGGGLTSRMLFIYVKEPPPPQAWTTSDPANDSLRCELARELNRIAQSSGEMTLDPDAKAYYIDSYNTFYTGSPFFANKYLAGYASRRAVHMLKLSMLFSMAESSTMTINLRHIDAAQGLLEDTEKNMVEVMSLITASDAGTKIDSVIIYIKKKRTVSRSQLQRHFQRMFHFQELDTIVRTLIATKQVRLITNGTDATFHYQQD